MDVALRSEIARLQAELVRVKQRANEELGALRAENARLRKQLDHLSDDPLLTLLRDPKAAAFPPHTPSASTGKLCADARYFEFGQVEEFLGGLAGLLSEGLWQSIAEECRDNEGGAWWAEYEYVVARVAEEDVDLPSTNKFKGQFSGATQIVRDKGHAGMALDDFVACQEALTAGLSAAEVAALRLYTGPLFRPLNAALRAKDVSSWATTIACCYSGVLKLSRLSKPARVYRGVSEEHLQLPDRFVAGADGGTGFTGGVERAFMSTSKNPMVALDYSGGVGAVGSIFAICFTEASRGASVQFLSQYPLEEELLFPPCTGLSCVGSVQAGRKRVLSVAVSVSTACPDVSEIATPDHVPGTAAALQWLGHALHSVAREVPMAFLEATAIDLSGVNCEAFVGHICLLIGRAGLNALPRLRSLKLHKCQLKDGAAGIARALSGNGTLEVLHVGGNSFGNVGGGASVATAFASALRHNHSLCGLDLRTNNMDAASCALIAKALRETRSLRDLNLSGNFVDTACAEALAAAIVDCPVFCCLRLAQCGLDGAAKALLLKAKSTRRGKPPFELVF
jgi:hypothetical protein